MSDLLSPDEIAQLFAAAKEGNLPEGPRRRTRRSRSIRKVDFSRPMKLSLVEQRRFERAHATFCRDAAACLSSELRAGLDLEVINSSQLTWQAALADVPQPSVLAIATCQPGAAVILLTLEEPLLLRMIERLLGGRFTDTPAPRGLTEIDLALGRRMFEELLRTLSSVWLELLGLTVSAQGFELHNTSLEYLPAIQAPIQPTLELTIEVRDQSASSTILLLVPFTAIERATKSLGGAGAKYEDGLSGVDTDGGSVRGALAGVNVEVCAEVGQVELTIGEVLALEQGDVISLGAAGNVGITIGDRRLHEAQPGLSGNRRAVKIIDTKGGEL